MVQTMPWRQRLHGIIFSLYFLFGFHLYSIPFTIIFARGLEVEKSTTILFWVFLLGVVILWPLSAVFEGITISQSMEDKFLLIACGLSTTAQSYVYIAAAQILNPGVLSHRRI